MNGAPKHALKVASGPVSPTSVPASFAVKPCTKWYITSLPSRRDTGGSTPKASAVSSTMVSGCEPRAPSATFGLQDSGYEKRVFSVIERSVRSSSRGSVSSIRFPGRGGTFSMMVPGSDSAAAITGSASLSRSMSFA